MHITKARITRQEVSIDSVPSSPTSKPLEERSKFPATSGILTIICACLTFSFANIALISAWLTLNINNSISSGGGSPSVPSVPFFIYQSAITVSSPVVTPLLPFPLYELIVGSMGIVFFAFGIFAGVSTMNRRFFSPSIFGLSLLLFYGVFISLPIKSSIAWRIGLPITILSIISILLIQKSKSEFHK